MEKESSGGIGEIGGKISKACWGWMWGRREDKDKSDTKVFTWLGTPSSEKETSEGWEWVWGGKDVEVSMESCEFPNN